KTTNRARRLQTAFDAGSNPRPRYVPIEPQATTTRHIPINQVRRHTSDLWQHKDGQYGLNRTCNEAVAGSTPVGGSKNGNECSHPVSHLEIDTQNWTPAEAGV